MSTQQDIYAAGFENRPPMLNKENYVPWSSRLLWYAKSRPRKLIYNSIINCSYVRRMIPEPGDQNREVKDNDQAIQTILLGLPEDIYAAVDMFHQDQPSSSTYMQQPLPNNINNYNLQLSFNQNYMQQPMPNPKDITDPTTAMNMTLVLMAKAFKLNYSTPTNNNQRISSNPRNRQIAQPSMNMGQDRQMQMVGGNDMNKFKQYAGQNVRNQNRLAKVKSWKLLESCGVHILTLITTQMILLVEKKYPLTRFILEQMLNNVRLEVEEESEMSLELLRLVRRQLQEGYIPE
nr:hypothetical protein [Tanacetum cinerariifolium]